MTATFYHKAVFIGSKKFTYAYRLIHGISPCHFNFLCSIFSKMFLQDKIGSFQG